MTKAIDLERVEWCWKKNTERVATTDSLSGDKGT